MVTFEEALVLHPARKRLRRIKPTYSWCWLRHGLEACAGRNFMEIQRVFAWSACFMLKCMGNLMGTVIRGTSDYSAQFSNPMYDDICGPGPPVPPPLWWRVYIVYYGRMYIGYMMYVSMYIYIYILWYLMYILCIWCILYMQHIYNINIYTLDVKVWV